MRCMSSGEPGQARWALNPSPPSPTSTGTSCPWIQPTTHGLPTLWVAKFPVKFRPHPSLHPPIPARAFVIPKQVTPSNLSLWRCRLGPAQTMIGHLGTPKDDHIVLLPAPDWTKGAFFLPLERRHRPMVDGTWQLTSAHPAIKVPRPPAHSSLGEPPHPFTQGLTGHRSMRVSARRHIPVREPGGRRLDRQPFSSRLGLPRRDEGGELRAVTSCCHQSQGCPTSSY